VCVGGGGTWQKQQRVLRFALVCTPPVRDGAQMSQLEVQACYCSAHADSRTALHKGQPVMQEQRQQQSSSDCRPAYQNQHVQNFGWLQDLAKVAPYFDL
jgi:hypothetical protein